MTGLAFKRVYVDLATGTHERLKELSKERGIPMKNMLAELIENAASGQATQQRGKRRSKKA